jgi:hypothetical protein
MRGVLTSIAAAAVVCAAGCAKGSDRPGDVDANEGDPPDAADRPDAADPPDASTTPDASGVPDATLPPDAAGCVPTAELCNGLDDDCNAATPDGAGEVWFGQPCDGTDEDACQEGAYGCNGVAQVCGDATGDSNLIVNGGFESGPFGGGWTETSTNFGTPVCDVANCGTGGGTAGPHLGTFWAWFGGFVGVEIATLSQTIVIPAGVATLTFWFAVPSCDGFGVDIFDVKIDGTPIYSTDDLDPACGAVPFVQKTFVVSAFANGSAHTLSFTSDTDSFAAATNFMVDDVRLVSCP